LGGRFISLISDSLRARHTDIHVPASAAVFTEITRTKFKLGKIMAVPERQPAPREVDLPPAIANHRSHNTLANIDKCESREARKAT
jgi:hypothetical protein